MHTFLVSVMLHLKSRDNIFSQYPLSINFMCCCYSAFFTDHTGEFDIAIRIYRGIFLFVLVTFLLAVNTWGWRKAGVNHVLIFELDPRDHLSYQHLLEVRVWCYILLHQPPSALFSRFQKASLLVTVQRDNSIT